MNIKELLNRSRQELLDLSTRNRLLSIPVGSKSARIVEVFDEQCEQVFKLLILDKKSMGFAPGRPSRKDISQEDGQTSGLFTEVDELSLPQPEEDQDAKIEVDSRHTSAKLKTKLTPEGLQGRLLGLFNDAKTMIEEQGVNILYLVVGHLKWFEADHSDSPRYAPLILIPVKLERKGASDRFRVQWTDDDLEENLSLRAKLKADFNIELPGFPDEDDFDVTKYFDKVRRAVSKVKGWEVLSDSITLGFFSFSKFLMYRDLDPENWPQEDMLLGHPIIRGLLQDGFPNQAALFPGDPNIDELIPVSKLDHVVDADSSQALAIEAVRQGKNIVIQGPPGTGKSQSIVNIISSAVLDGKKVLFVAEKLAALEVVKRRLEREGLGAMCLELHSNKSNKKAVIEDITRTWRLGRPAKSDLEFKILKLEQKRARLNEHASHMNEIFVPSGLTPYFIIGSLASLGERAKKCSDLSFIKAEEWTGETRNEARKIIEELSLRIKDLGIPSLHPWRGVCCDIILPIDIDPLENKIKNVCNYIKELNNVLPRLASTLNLSCADTLDLVEKQKLIAEFILKAPVVDKQALCDSVWNNGFDNLCKLIQEGKEFDRVFKEIGDKADKLVWNQDFSIERAHISSRGKSLLRFFSIDYCRSIKKIRRQLKIRLSASCEEKLALLDKVIVGQRAMQALHTGATIAKSAFGYMWKDENTDWKGVQAIIDWVAQENSLGLNVRYHETFSKLNQLQIAQLIQDLTNCLTKLSSELFGLFAFLKLDVFWAFSVNSFQIASLQSILDRCELWLSKMDDLSQWNNYYLRASMAREFGLGSLINKMENGDTPSEESLDSFDRIYYGQLLRAVIKKRPDIGKFDGVLQSSIVNDFKKLDKDRLLLSKYRALMKHYDSMPPVSDGVGPSGIVNAEGQRKRGHRSVRKLLNDAGSIVQSIKPVFMMSPLSVAQFLETGAVKFDLLVIDEASQVQPVDSFGAVARCGQIVVVGDAKQLPPSRFFTRLTSDTLDGDDDNIDGTAEAKDIESILGLCSARGFPSRMLRWHYRSRHHSLIAVSNREFYDNELFIVPSPHSTSENLGLKFNHIPEGVFDRGNSGTNRAEAKVVCRSIMEHARNYPDLSLGVAAFSVRQRQVIMDELEVLRRESPETESFFSGNPNEPFFVKNLENVQGDERDVIFISVGYGKDAHGYMAMNFGPLSNEGGERRLNVLISRAKLRCEVFSSITADDIDLERVTGRGGRSLKIFLNYAKTGLLDISKSTGREEDSPFEEEVRRAVEAVGYEVDPQVGIAGFFIDLAVRDKNGSGSYLLGIECDGASYHSSKSARDRDRLRQAVLEDHGWIIHRIWSFDWFQRPQEQLRKVVVSIEKAKVLFSQTKSILKFDDRKASELDSGESIARESKKVQHEVKFTVPYKEAKFAVTSKLAPHEVPKIEMANVIFRIVDIEGPIHEDEIVIRVRELWGVNRAGNRIQDAVTEGVQSVLNSKKCKRSSGFLYIPGKSIQIRDRENVSSANLRKPEMISPLEIQAAILVLINAYHGAARDEIPFAVARLLGFKSTGALLKGVIDNEVRKLLSKGEIVDDGSMLRGGINI